MSKKFTVRLKPNGVAVTNDHSHESHDEHNPDDGSISPTAIAFAEALKKFGIEARIIGSR